MSVFINTVVLCILVTVNLSDTARILAVFPVPSISHQVVFRPFTQELAKRGHEVVVITPDPAFTKDKPPKNITEIDVHDISYKIWRETFMVATKGNKDDLVSQIEIVMKALIWIADAQLKDKNVNKLINDKSQQFDLLIVEACMETALLYSHIYKVPVIQMSSFGASYDNYEVIGAPSHPILYPSVLRTRLNNLTTWEKITELYLHYRLECLFASMTVRGDEMLRSNFGPHMPTLRELKNNVDMLFLNVNPLFEGIRPVPPSVVYLGGLPHKPTKKLPEDLKSYLDSSKNGVIYISFGTNVDPSLLPDDRIAILVKTVSKLPYDILWKWNTDVLPGRTENIKISKWLPQSDLLKHPNIKAFVTQGGLQSTDEAIEAGVPLIGIPMLGDQWFNAEKYVHYRIGMKLDMDILTEDQFRNAINTVIGDDRYRRNIVKLRELMMDQPLQPLERAVWWAEYLLRHGGAKHLRSPAANITWTEYLELELVLILLAFVLITSLLVGVIIRQLYRKVVRNYVIVVKNKSD